MVKKINKIHDEEQTDLDITDEAEVAFEPELQDIEDNSTAAVSALKHKLKHAEEECRTLRDELQRNRADFLNAKRRLEEEKKRDYGRTVARVMTDILPLCDSFELAMRNKESWEKADEVWRKGVEGIYAQLQGLLSTYHVVAIDPTGEEFNPHLHEALSLETVTDKALHDMVVSTIQSGYQITHKDGTTEIIRPARVTIGAHAE